MMQIPDRFPDEQREYYVRRNGRDHAGCRALGATRANATGCVATAPGAPVRVVYRPEPLALPSAIHLHATGDSSKTEYSALEVPCLHPRTRKEPGNDFFQPVQQVGQKNGRQRLFVRQFGRLST